MMRMLGACGLLAAVALLFPTGTPGQEKKKKQPRDEASAGTAQEYQQLVQAKEVAGKLVQADLSGRTLTLRLDFPHLEQNPKYKPPKNNQIYRQIQKLALERAQLQNIKNPIQRQQRAQRIAQQIQRLQRQLAGAKANPNNLPFKIVTTSKDFVLEMTENVSVRWLNPPVVYDDKGFRVEYGKEELARLKDKDKPGYRGKLDDLASGQPILVHVKPPKQSKDKEGSSSSDIARPIVTMIVILQEAADPIDSPPPKKKKK